MNSETRDAAAADGTIGWSDAYLVGYPPLDRVHRDFVDALANGERAIDADFGACLDALLQAATAQFDAEDRWMTDTAFPPRDCHQQEHAAVMASLRAVVAVVEDGDIAEGRRLVAALGEWFPRHVAHLDSALAHWLFRQRSPGKPIVLRRGASADA